MSMRQNPSSKKRYRAKRGKAAQKSSFRSPPCKRPRVRRRNNSTPKDSRTRSCSAAPPSPSALPSIERAVSADEIPADLIDINELLNLDIDTPAEPTSPRNNEPSEHTNALNEHSLHSPTPVEFETVQAQHSQSAITSDALLHPPACPFPQLREDLLNLGIDIDEDCEDSDDSDIKSADIKTADIDEESVDVKIEPSNEPVDLDQFLHAESTEGQSTFATKANLLPNFQTYHDAVKSSEQCCIIGRGGDVWIVPGFSSKKKRLLPNKYHHVSSSPNGFTCSCNEKVHTAVGSCCEHQLLIELAVVKGNPTELIIQVSF